MDLDYERERVQMRERDGERDRERERERERDPREKEPHQREGMSYNHPMMPAPVPRKVDDGISHVGYPYSQASSTRSGAVNNPDGLIIFT